MTDAEWFKLALEGLMALVLIVVGWFVKSSRDEMRGTRGELRKLSQAHEAFREEVLKELREFSEKLSRVEFTLFGVNGTNGVYGDVALFAKWRTSAHGWLNALAAQIGLELREDGTTREVPGVLHIERRLERRAGEERRRDLPDGDDAGRRHGERRDREG